MDGASMGRAFGDMLNGLLVLSIAFVVLFVGVAIYGGYKFWHRNDPHVYKLQERVSPTIELTTDGATVDTLYVYTFK